MPVGVWSKRRERQYEHVLAQELARGRTLQVAKRIAAATVNKQRTRMGETLAQRRAASAYHSHPAHPYSHPRTTRHRRR